MLKRLKLHETTVKVIWSLQEVSHMITFAFGIFTISFHMINNLLNLYTVMIDLRNPHTIMIESRITRLNHQPTCVRLNHRQPNCLTGAPKFTGGSSPSSFASCRWITFLPRRKGCGKVDVVSNFATRVQQLRLDVVGNFWEKKCMYININIYIERERDLFVN